MSTPTQKTIAGALLIGASLATGNAIAIATAGAVGTNWTSEGLADLWQAREAIAPGTALSQAAARTIRRATDELRRAYQAEVGKDAPTDAFALVRDCAGAVVVAEPPAGAATPLAAQTALAPALDALLYGHDTRAVAFLRSRLLPAVAEVFRAELASDDAAWRLFYGWLLEGLANQQAQLAPALARLPALLAALADQSRAQQALEDAVDTLAALLAELRAAIAGLEAGQGAVTFENTNLQAGGTLRQAGGDIGGALGASGGGAAPARSVSFRNERVRVEGDVEQAGGDIYHDSTRVRAGETAVVQNGEPPAEEE
ncbi:MAG TPA: hypothetical protein VFS21_27525 [Roseiflexaceae bacterium]|nr:hypothetical protein [Roseiflexaceae bacterium]